MAQHCTTLHSIASIAVTPRSREKKKTKLARHLQYAKTLGRVRVHQSESVEGEWESREQEGGIRSERERTGARARVRVLVIPCTLLVPWYKMAPGLMWPCRFAIRRKYIRIRIQYACVQWGAQIKSIDCRSVVYRSEGFETRSECRGRVRSDGSAGSTCAKDGWREGESKRDVRGISGT